MVSSRSPFQRRRSQSTTTTSSPSRRSIDNAYRLATKRAHPHCSSSSSSLSSEPSSPSRWESGVWRQGKRRRKEAPSLGPFDMDIDHAQTISYGGNVPRRTAALPSSPSAFQLSAGHRRRSSNGRRFSIQSESALSTDIYDAELEELRSNAHWELQRSVAENGECLVRRMRDYENSSRAKRRLSVSSPPPPVRPEYASDYSDDGDDDDVQILDGASNPVAQPWFGRPASPFHQRTSPHSSVSLDSFINSPRTSSHYIDPTSPSALPSPTVSSSSSTPALTRVRTNSTRSSVISLPLGVAATRPSSPRSDNDPAPVHPTSSRTDKAIAALSLALANGAAGLNDYSILRERHIPHAMDECHVGELWN